MREVLGKGVFLVGGIYPGYPLPLGVHLHNKGAQFALLSRGATRVFLLLFAKAEDEAPSTVIDLDPRHFRTGDIWHVWVAGVQRGEYYAYRIDGPYEPREGHRYNRQKIIIDPYAPALSRKPVWDFRYARGYDLDSDLLDLSFSDRDNARYAPRCVITGDDFDWEGYTTIHTPWSETIIYETHVRGLTVHPSSGVTHPGSFAGVIQKIPYLKELGVTAVEFLPVHEFNEGELYKEDPTTGSRLSNYWGYSTVAFFAPKAGYAADEQDGGQVLEFKRMVRELHKAGMEVILDVVFNHTAEGNELGPTFSFRGIDNAVCYILKEEKRLYQNFSGCGNTVNCNHPVVRQFIIDCLTYWAVEMHVDGFRFDLASIMGRDQNGEIMSNPPLLEEISEHPILRKVKLIAEAWDAAGAYQVGFFQNHLWSEWNGKFRDDIRRFWRGDKGMAGFLASRICGSADIYQRSGKEPLNSINFITCHDGFTLNDLVSYARKHNEANGENNGDGSDANYSSNYGAEGPTHDPQIERIRLRQIKNFIATLFVSRGVPLFLGGDEFRRTQKGNNNAYCQDNEVSWYNWELFDKNRHIFRFTREMIAFRKRNRVVREVKFYEGSDIEWFGDDAGPPDWSVGSRSVACRIFGSPDLYLIFHAGSEGREFRIPPSRESRRWHLAVDTSKREPDDIHGPGEEKLLDRQDRYPVADRSIVILIGK